MGRYVSSRILAGIATLSAIGLALLWQQNRASTSGESTLLLTRSAGATLLAHRCSTCHLLPHPDMLPKSGWRSFMSDKRNIIGRAIERRGLDTLLLPGSDELDAIATYLTNAAPTQEELVSAPDTSVARTDWFEVHAFKPLDSSLRTDGYVDAIVDNVAERMLLADIGRGGIGGADLSGRTLDFLALHGLPARLTEADGMLLVAVMESGRGGHIVGIDSLRTGSRGRSQVLIDNLERPIRAYPAWLDDRAGIMVEEFGIERGGLRFWPATSDGYGQPRELLDAAGVVGSTLADFDGDGRLEIAVLVSQESERLLILPSSARRMQPVEVFQGHAGYGFNGLTGVDVNSDGRIDLVAWNGDNYDIESGPLKPYHGVRIFLNQGGLRFAAPIFLQMHGVIDVVADDFDLDDDVDLLAVSAFPDHRVRPFQSAVLFDQVEPLRFLRRLIEPAQGSRWIAAETVDLDRDSDPDVVLLGGRSMTTDADRRWSEGAGPNPMKLLVLRNTRSERQSNARQPH